MRKLTSLQAHQKMLKFCKFVREQNLDVSERLKMFPVTVEILTPTAKKPQNKLQFHTKI